jgi:hypothetical protein
MYVNAKMIAVETVSGIRGRGMKEISGGGEFKIDLIQCKNLCKFTIYNTQHNNKKLFNSKCTAFLKFFLIPSMYSRNNCSPSCYHQCPRTSLWALY